MMERCHNHPNVESLSICHNCGKSFCADCLNEGNTYYYCNQEACRVEMQRQGDELVEDNFPAGEETKLVTVGIYSHVYEADLAISRLESEGIMAFAADEFMANLNWLYSNAIGGVRLQVPAPDAERAREILSTDESADLKDVFPEEDQKE